MKVALNKRQLCTPSFEPSIGSSAISFAGDASCAVFYTS